MRMRRSDADEERGGGGGVEEELTEDG